MMRYCSMTGVLSDATGSQNKRHKLDDDSKHPTESLLGIAQLPVGDVYSHKQPVKEI